MLETTTDTKPSIASKFLTFYISQERYGFEILKVQEIIKVPYITCVPRSPDYIKGVINLRGKIIPVMDLRIRFGIEPIPYSEKTCIIVINVVSGDRKIAIGVIVDTVLEVMNFASSEIEPAPDYGAHLDTQFIIGMGKKDTTVNILIDIEKVISANVAASIVGL